jgi:hypothetical protein
MKSVPMQMFGIVGLTMAFGFRNQHSDERTTIPLMTIDTREHRGTLDVIKIG